VLNPSFERTGNERVQHLLAPHDLSLPRVGTK
jgi:hypothetical protein